VRKFTEHKTKERKKNCNGYSSSHTWKKYGRAHTNAKNMEEIRTLHTWKRLQQKFISPYMEKSGISRHIFFCSYFPQKANKSGREHPSRR
jgi:hypothetical protein